MDMGEDKAYLWFAPTLEDIKEAVWKGGKAGGHRMLQLLSGHCNLAGYLNSRGKRAGAQCDNCGMGEKGERGRGALSASLTTMGGAAARDE